MIYLFNPTHKWNSSIWNHSCMDTFIHVNGLKSHQALNYELKAPSLGFMLMHKPSSTHLWAHKFLCNLSDFLATCYNTPTGLQVLIWPRWCPCHWIQWNHGPANPYPTLLISYHCIKHTRKLTSPYITLPISPISIYNAFTSPQIPSLPHEFSHNCISGAIYLA
jgi:hypothetical protein